MLILDIPADIESKSDTSLTFWPATLWLSASTALPLTKYCRLDERLKRGFWELLLVASYRRRLPKKELSFRLVVPAFITEMLPITDTFWKEP